MGNICLGDRGRIEAARDRHVIGQSYNWIKAYLCPPPASREGNAMRPILELAYLNLAMGKYDLNEVEKGSMLHLILTAQETSQANVAATIMAYPRLKAVLQTWVTEIERLEAATSTGRACLWLN
jgi:hypothetical protein